MHRLVSSSRRLLLLAWVCCLAAGTSACGEIQPGQPDGGNPLPDALDVDSGALPDAIDEPPDARLPPLQAVSHSTSLMVQGGHSLFCSNQSFNPPRHTDNSFFRVFHLPDFDITGPFQVTRVLVGVEVADSPIGVQPVQIRLYTLPDGAQFLLGNLELLDIYDANITDRALGTLEVTTDTRVPAGATLVVELFTPSGVENGNRFYPGGNSLGQSGPTYLAAAACNLLEPTDWATFVDQGGPNRHLVMSVYGRAAP
jgi:hypothetical protein